MQLPKARLKRLTQLRIIHIGAVYPAVRPVLGREQRLELRVLGDEAPRELDRAYGDGGGPVQRGSEQAFGEGGCAPGGASCRSCRCRAALRGCEHDVEAAEEEVSYATATAAR